MSPQSPLPSRSATAFAAAALLIWLAAGTSPLAALEVTLRLVRSEAPSELVSTATTTIDVEAERAQRAAEMEQARALAEALGTEFAMTDEPVRPKAEFDRYANYMRGIVIDGNRPFARTYQGSFLGRSDTVTLSLDDGEHVIDPGGHRFTIAGDTITTDDPTLRPHGAVLDILTYPVTVIAIDGGAIRDLPAEVLRLPVAPRLFWGEESLLPVEKLLAETATFKRLTLYMIGNSGPTPYRIQPSDRTFFVGPEGVTVLDAAGQPAQDRGVYVENRYTLVIPKFPVPVRLQGANLQLLITGQAGQLRLASSPAKPDIESIFYAFAAPEGSELIAGNRASAPALPFYGDLGLFPRRRIVVDNTAAESAEPRVLAVALESHSVDAGARLRVRVQARDALDAATLAPLEVSAYLAQQPVLRADGSLQPRPDPDAPLSAWRALRLLATSEPELYAIEIPGDLPSNVYWLRIVADRRGAGSPHSALQADFIEGIIHPGARSTLSVFCPQGRHAFSGGAVIPFSVVAKSTVGTAAGKLNVRLSRGGVDLPLLERDLPALPPGRHPVHLRLAARATSALPPGDYTLQASLGAIASNPWRLRIVRPRYRQEFPHYDHGWGTGNIDDGSLYANVPADIAEANEQHALLARNAAILGQQCNINFSDFSVFRGFNMYQGRDSGSEVAEVEMLLRRHPSLPAHEVYYYPNHFESVCNALAEEGMGEFNALLDGFSPRSLCHSVASEIHSKMRQYELTAQTAQKYENFIGMTLVKDDTVPIGDTEVGDSGRTLRLIEQRRQFMERHGFERPAVGDVVAFFREAITGTPSAAQREAAHRWETWAVDENCLLGDFYGLSRQAVDPILPGLRLGISGPGWGSTFGGGYPVTAHRHQDPLFVQIGSGDYGMMLILEPLLRTRMFSMTGSECWGTQGFHGTPGFYNLKAHFIGFLAAGATGYGYYHGRSLELANPRLPHTLGVQEERQDMRDLLQTYGAMFRGIRPEATVAVLYPFHQTMYEVINPEINGAPMLGAFDAAYSAIGQLAFLGHTTEILTEEAIDAGALSRLKVVIAPALHYALPRHVEALAKFVREGGTLLLGARSTLVPAGARTLADNDFAECPEVNAKWSYNKLLDIGHAYVLGEMRRKAAGLRAQLAPLVTPHAQPATDRVIVQTSRAGDARYTFVWNMLFPSWMGTERVCRNAEWSNSGMEANESTLVPLRERVSFPADMATYELFSQARVAGEPRDGRVEAVADLAFTPFRIFVSLPAPIARLRIAAPPSVAQGAYFPVRITPLSADGQPLNACVPMRLAALDAAGQEVWTTTGAAFPEWHENIAAPLTAAPGAWRLRVKELVSGREAEVALAVTPPQALPFGDAVTELPAVDVQRAALVRQFLEARRQDGQTVLVLLDESQVATRRELADQAAQMLQSLGIKADVRRMDAPGVFASGERVHLYQNWTEMAPGQYIDHPLCLLGGEGESVLIEELQENQLLERGLTMSYPGAGRGVVTLVRSPFAYGRDVLGLFGPDADGIRAAIAQVGDIGRGETPPETPAPEPELAVQEPEGRVEPGTPFMTMDGAPTLAAAVAPTGDRIAFTTLGYATNLFVFAPDGHLLAADKVGHLQAMGVALLADGRAVVHSDGMTYLRAADGTLKWRVAGVVHIDPSGRYLLARAGNGLAAYDLDLTPLWAFDEWPKYATTQEMLWARKATFLAALEGGATVAYRLEGKAPGIGGAYGDHVVFCDALSGAEQRRAAVPTDAILAAAGRAADTTVIQVLERHADGAFYLARLEARGVHPLTDLVLLNAELQPVAAERFKAPGYFANARHKSNRTLLADGRMVFTVGDTLCVADTNWTALATLRTDNLILSLAVDEARGRIAIANYDGEVIACDPTLKEAWRAQVGSAAQLAFLPDGRLAVGTLRGEARLLDAGGQTLWTRSLNAYNEPEAVEARWTQLEAVPSLQPGDDAAWWERLQQSLELGPADAALAGEVSAAAPAETFVPAEAFGTYLVEWTYGPAARACALSLRVTEEEEPLAGVATPPRSHLALTVTAGDTVRTERALLRLGDRPRQIGLRVTAAGDGAAHSAVALRPLAFPSANLVRMPSLYRGQINHADRANPPVSVELFFNVEEAGAPHVTRWADPLALVNGRMLEPEAGLLGGAWFGTGNFFMGDNYMQVPCWVELTLPRKRVVSHVVVAEDPTLPRAAVMSIDAYIESRETRKGLSEFEQRQLQRGFWQNVARCRDNRNAYNVFRLTEPVFTRKLRVYVLAGHSAITEIEVYGALPEALQKAEAAP